ncbi:MAG: helix-turn-helix transcriptional regulator [Desulfobacteraceae bacterium]|nr:helix-turn-helix transcriptional regulator [Desulfobacteraceae bacterium]
MTINTYLPHTCGTSEESGRRLGITISIAPQLFCDLVQGDFDRVAAFLDTVSEKNKEKLYFHKGRITPLMQIALHQIINCPYQGITKRLYLESRALELIVYKLEQMATQEGKAPKALSVKSDDVDRVYHAKEIIIRDLENPPTLFELAGQVGLSHAKLNRCFRELYGTTVFGFLRKTRLEKARFLLEEKQINVTDAALKVGYSSLSSFIHAFSDHFGIKPSFCVKRHL